MKQQGRLARLIQKIPLPVPKQYNIPRLGAMIDSLYTSLPILSIINFLAISTVLYATVHEYLFRWAPWLTFWIFIGFLVAATLTMMTLMYKFVLPSLWTFRQKQMNKFENAILDEMRKLHKEIEELKEAKK